MVNDDDDQQLVQQYVEGIQIGVGKTFDLAVEDGYERLSRRSKKPPYRVLEIWAHGTNPFTEFRVVLKGDT